MVHARSKSSAIACGEFDADDGLIDMVMSQLILTLILLIWLVMYQQQLMFDLL